MRVIVPHDVTDGFGGFAVWLVRVIPRVVHRIQNPSLNGLQAVAHIRNGAILNDIFGIPAEPVTNDFLQIGRQKVLQ
ncbi:hypothetical protein D3C77_422650 [compost metagenome]